MLLFLGGGKVAYLIPPFGTFRLTQNKKSREKVIRIEGLSEEDVRCRLLRTNLTRRK